MTRWLAVLTVGAIAGLSLTVLPIAHAVGAATTSGFYTPVTPARILDTRNGTGGFSAPLGPGGSLDLTVTGVGGVPSTHVTSVVMNVTVTDTTSPSYLTVWPGGQSRPTASNLNWVAGNTIPNLVTVAVGNSGDVSFYNFAGSTDVVADVVGWYSDSASTGGGHVALTPARILDTRNGTGAAQAPLGTGGTLTLAVTGHGGVPTTGVSAVVMNVTVTDTTSPSYLTVWPGGQQPTASNLNWVAGQTIPNLVTVAVSGTGTVSFFNFAGSTDVVADVVGWYSASASTGDEFTSMAPVRILDTRNGTGGYSSPLGGGGSLNLNVEGVGGVPASGVSAAVMNVTVTDTTGSSYLTGWPAGASQPLASNLNWVPGQTIPNLVSVGAGPNGRVDIYNFAGNADVVADISGYFLASSPPPSGIYTGAGFDTCTAPSQSQMSTWVSSSPYRSIGIYVGGANIACSQPNLTASWVSTVETQGWSLVPLYVGLQAPCVDQSGLATINPGSAFSQGQAAATDAASKASQVGIPGGSALYFDMEAYNNSVAGCTNTVLTFISGWVQQLHGSGYLAGVYSSASSGIEDEANAVGNSSYTIVDDIWLADWDNKCSTVFGYPQYVPDSDWTNHQRLHQCMGGHNETYNSVTLNIDTDYDDGAVAIP